MDLGLAGRSCAVTGGSRGIGRRSARMLCEAGADVLLIARGAEDLEEAVAECNDSGVDGEASALALDVTAADAAERIREAAGGTASVLLPALARSLPVRVWYPIR